jgi:hypothetical protein
MLIVFALWMLSGLVFWLCALVHCGVPNRWSSQGRDLGWLEWIALLPPTLSGGPVWWVVYVFVRSSK